MNAMWSPGRSSPHCSLRARAIIVTLPSVATGPFHPGAEDPAQVIVGALSLRDRCFGCSCSSRACGNLARRFELTVVELPTLNSKTSHAPNSSQIIAPAQELRYRKDFYDSGP